MLRLTCIKAEEHFAVFSGKVMYFKREVSLSPILMQLILFQKIPFRFSYFHYFAFLQLSLIRDNETS